MSASRPPAESEQIEGGVRQRDVRRLLLLLPLALLACGDDGESFAAQTTTTAEPTAPETDLDDGRHLGVIEAVEDRGEGVSIELDVVQWLTGDEADRAAAEDGFVEPGEDVPNDYYVRNVNERLRTLAIGDARTIAVVERSCCDTQPLASVAEWVEWYRASDPDGFGGPGAYWWVTVDDGRVVGIEEQYRP